MNIMIETQNSDGTWVAAFGMAPKRPVTDPGFEPAVRSYLHAHLPGHLGRQIHVIDETTQTVILSLEG